MVGHPGPVGAVVVLATDGVPNAGDEVVEHEDGENEADDPHDHGDELCLDGVQDQRGHLHEAAEAEQAEQPDESQESPKACAPHKVNEVVRILEELDPDCDDVYDDDAEVHAEPAPQVSGGHSLRGHDNAAVLVEARQEIHAEVDHPEARGGPLHPGVVGKERRQLHRHDDDIVDEQQRAEEDPDKPRFRLGVEHKATPRHDRVVLCGEVFELEPRAPTRRALDHPIALVVGVWLEVVPRRMP
mmetsp:Transcript_75430/g.217824  ORF Transcript_75430/g.217824 Transcript_75430/m.217824 type:complete len:243 (+) Transcript_75430:1078-1806(+)